MIVMLASLALWQSIAYEIIERYVDMYQTTKSTTPTHLLPSTTHLPPSHHLPPSKILILIAILIQSLLKYVPKGSNENDDRLAVANSLSEPMMA